MKKDVSITKSIKLVSAALATGGLLATGTASGVTLGADQNPFSAEQLPKGYMVAAGHGSKKEPCDENMRGKKASEGSCGGMKKSGEGKCGEGACGSMKKSGEGACGGMKKKGY